MKIHNLEQGSQSWHDFRASHFCASESAAMLGLSQYMTRTKLLHLKKTGEKPAASAVQQAIFDNGHRVEALARPLVESMISEELFPAVCSDGRLSVSCDGLTLSGEIAFEHKQWNQALAALVAAGTVPDSHMPQCQQVLMITGAHRLIFVCSDGTRANWAQCEVKPDSAWFDRIRAGWAQFELDLAAYTHEPATVAPAGHAPEALPELVIQLTGMVNASNLNSFKKHALGVFESISTDLSTDQDFADAEKTSKWCGAVEKKLELAKEQALAQTASIAELFAVIDELKEEARQKRLALEKLVKTRKESIKTELVGAAEKKWAELLNGLQSEFGSVKLVTDAPQFSNKIKGLRTIDSIKDALATEIANSAIEATKAATELREKLAFFEDYKQHSMIFMDLQALVAKPIGDFKMTVSARVAAFLEQQAAKLEADKAAEAKAQAAKLEAAQAQAQAVDSIKPAPAPARTLTILDINQRLDPLSVSDHFLRRFGFYADSYTEEQFLAICETLINHIRSCCY